MAKRESVLLRIDPKILDAIKRWANDDLRSTNGQIEFLLREVLLKTGRLTGKVDSGDCGPADSPSNRGKMESS